MKTFNFALIALMTTPVLAAPATAHTPQKAWYCEAQCAAYQAGDDAHTMLDPAMGSSDLSLGLAFSDMIADCGKLMVEAGLGSKDMYLVTQIQSHRAESDSSSYDSGSSEFFGGGWRWSAVGLSGYASSSSSHFESTEVSATFALAQRVCAPTDGKVDLGAARRARARYRGPGNALGG